jgi:hypothetical protein
LITADGLAVDKRLDAVHVRLDDECSVLGGGGVPGEAPEGM